MITLIGDSHPKARTEHRCSDCGRTIGVGEEYRRQRLVGDDGPYVWKDCAHCEVAVNWVWFNVEGARYLFEDGLDLGEYLRDYDDPRYQLWANGWRQNGVLVPVAAVSGTTPTDKDDHE